MGYKRIKLVNVKKFSKNVYNKSKVIVISARVSIFIFLSGVKNSNAMGLVPLPRAPIIRAENNYILNTVKVNVRKENKIIFVKFSQLPVYFLVIDKKATSTSEINELIKRLRGGALIDAATALILIFVILQISGVGIEGFQMPVVPRNPKVYRTINSNIQKQINYPKHRGSVTLKMTESGQYPINQTQVSNFEKDGKIDLRECYGEVIRRSESLDCDNWVCSFPRFKSLATENGVISSNSAREAITVLNGEMLGLYTDSARVDYGRGVYGPDFKVTGQKEFSHTTHVEIKNPVGSAIEKASRNGFTDIVKQGNSIGDKISKQQSKWSNATFRASLNNLNPNAAFPQGTANTLGLVDEFDVPVSEKLIVQNSVKMNCTNISNIVFINN